MTGLRRALHRFWPHSLKGQVLLAIALALLFAQGFSAVLLYRAQHARQESGLLHTAAMRLVAAHRNEDLRTEPAVPESPRDARRTERRERIDRFRSERLAQSPITGNETRLAHDEEELGEILRDQDVTAEQLLVVRRPVSQDIRAQMRLAHRKDPFANVQPETVLVASMKVAGSSDWVVARVFVPQTERFMLQTLFMQTLFIYAVLVGAMWLILRRITRPLAALTQRVAHFAETRDADGQLDPQGPDDVRHLIEAQNAMERRVLALLDEKDVMLGAIGHDLKTPLAALRVRIESVEDEAERGRMARTIEDITRTLDDILSLARVGRPSDQVEQTELYALVASVVEEYEDMGDPVTLVESSRMAMQLRPTWVRRALRNLISNALRYGKTAQVTLERDGRNAVIRIVDEGPGIPADKIALMLEPFTRGDPSRNSETGGAGLGLTLARAIAEQHGGSLLLANRTGADGSVIGLEAILRLRG
ncbi:ATP-binding protein [Novosphingobium sp.]|uniref:sensor histidine kinase n=1 Tax=Novosphingobium sp. TaxID=1874826 RepID=UPI00286E3608|nr:ATP-binding protein [Novosphingobium sp.]